MNTLINNSYEKSTILSFYAVIHLSIVGAIFSHLFHFCFPWILDAQKWNELIKIGYFQRHMRGRNLISFQLNVTRILRSVRFQSHQKSITRIKIIRKNWFVNSVGWKSTARQYFNGAVAMFFCCYYHSFERSLSRHGQIILTTTTLKTLNHKQLNHTQKNVLKY